MKIYFILLITTLLYISCSEEKKEEVKFQMIEMQKDIPIYSSNGDSNQYHIEIKFPLLSCSNNSILEDVNFELNKYFFNHEGNNLYPDPRKNFENMVSSIRSLYDKENEHNDTKILKINESLNFELIKEGAVIYNKNKILSVACEIIDYTGGAHSMNYKEFLHFDLNTGKRFGINQLFDQEAKQNLLRIVSEKCTEMKKDEKNQIFEEAQIETCDNFYFDDKNFVFVYNPYEIGPFSAGYIAISIPISEIKPLLKKDINPGFSDN